MTILIYVSAGFILGAGVFYLGHLVGTSQAREMIKIWSREEKAVAERKLKAMDIMRRGQERAKIGTIGSEDRGIPT